MRFCSKSAAQSPQPKCVRDWSGILLERSGKRYSGKPDAKRNAQKKSHQDTKTLSRQGIEELKRQCQLVSVQSSELLVKKRFRFVNDVLITVGTV